MPRPLLRAVPSVAPGGPEVQFCGHCGQPPRNPEVASRVCDRCHLGMVLRTDADLAPKAKEPFVVVDRSLCVCAVSRSAERLLCVEEPDAVNRILTEFLVPADAERAAQDNLMSLIVAAASGSVPMATTVVRPAGEFGVFLEARIGLCGPPPAALVVLSDIR